MCTRAQNVIKPPVELADVFRMHGDAYCKANRLTPEQYKVMHAIINCRTSALGGHIDECKQCGFRQNSYNSCRNRHCPKCESFKAANWLEARKAELLPVSYFHVVFTLPHELNNLVLYNKRTLYHLLFESAWQVFKTLVKDPKRLNGEMGMLAILHTWGQNLSQHNHVHCIIPGGALTFNGKWKHAKKYLFPVKVLSKLFRGIFVSQLRRLYEQKALKLPEQLTEKLSQNQFDRLLDTLMEKDWVVYAKPPFGSPEKLLSYLGRYTHKMVISNHRILACDEKSVTFKWRDYADGNKVKIMRLKPEEFIRRILSHVVPKGFMRIRSFGFLANAVKAKKIKVIQRQLKYQPPKKAEKEDTATLMFKLTGKDITLCPKCKQGKRQRVAMLLPKFNRTLFDTS